MGGGGDGAYPAHVEGRELASVGARDGKSVAGGSSFEGGGRLSFTWLGISWAGLIVLGVPLQAVATRRRLSALRPTAAQAYASTCLGLGLTGFLTLDVDLASGRHGLRAATTGLPPGPLAAWTLAALATCLALSAGFMGVRKLARAPIEPRVLALLPRTGGQRLGFAGVSLMAGVVEEFVMRGFCLGTLAAAFHSVPVALALVTLSFGLAHAYQGRLAVLSTAALGLVLAIPVLATGSLAPSMAAHTVADLVLGAAIGPLARRWGIAGEAARRD